MSDLVGNSEDRFSRVVAHFYLLSHSPFCPLCPLGPGGPWGPGSPFNPNPEKNTIDPAYVG